MWTTQVTKPVSAGHPAPASVRTPTSTRQRPKPCTPRGHTCGSFVSAAAGPTPQQHVIAALETYQGTRRGEPTTRRRNTGSKVPAPPAASSHTASSGGRSQESADQTGRSPGASPSPTPGASHGSHTSHSDRREKVPVPPSQRFRGCHRGPRTRICVRATDTASVRVTKTHEEGIVGTCALTDGDRDTAWRPLTAPRLGCRPSWVPVHPDRSPPPSPELDSPWLVTVTNRCGHAPHGLLSCPLAYTQDGGQEALCLQAPLAITESRCISAPGCDTG